MCSSFRPADASPRTASSAWSISWAGAPERRKAAAAICSPGSSASSDPAVAELALPDRMILGSEIAHSEQAGCLVMPEDLRHRGRFHLCSGAQPLDLVAVSFDRRAPIGCHAQLGQGALDDEALSRSRDTIDIR